jgi:hypothetical protein
MTTYKRSVMALPQTIFLSYSIGNTRLVGFADDVNLMGRDINTIRL